MIDKRSELGSNLLYIYLSFVKILIIVENNLDGYLLSQFELQKNYPSISRIFFRDKNQHGSLNTHLIQTCRHCLLAGVKKEFNSFIAHVEFHGAKATDGEVADDIGVGANDELIVASEE